MAKYQQYYNFKESFLVWMGNVPEHWDINKFKWIFQEKTKTLNPSLPAGSISFGNVIYKNEKNLSPDTKASYQEVLNGEYLINPLNLNFDLKSLRTALSQIDVVVSTGYIVLIDNGKFNKQYLRWLLYEFDVAHMKKLGSGVRQTINYTDIANSLFFHPEFNEQTQIANFLDHETAQIDTLIDKQQTLIQLLKEKRQAVISHAVTKGLNPDVIMKDSGVEWLGNVPENWEVSKLKYYSSIQGGYAFSSDSFIEEGVQILKIGNVYQNRLALERQPTFVPEAMLEALPDFIVKDGDILMSLTGTLGKRDYGFAVAIKDDGKYLLNQRVAKLNPADEKIDRDFLLNVLWSESYLNQLYSLPSGTKQANLSNSDVLDIVITLPPSKNEQKEIAVELQNQKDIFDKAIQKAMTSIELMQERRTALISAAVTGKIDVRGWQAAEQS